MTMTTTLMVCFVFGIAAGIVSLKSLQWTVDRYVQGRSAKAAIGVQLLRLAVLAGMLLVFARLGAQSLLAVAGGLLVSRIWLVRRASRA